MSAAVPKRPKMTIESQMKASQWLFKNAEIVAEMTLEQVAAAINTQCGLAQTIPVHSTRRLMEAAGMTWKAASKAEAGQKLRHVYDKLLVLQGRVEKQDETIRSQQVVIETLMRRVDALVENTNWVTAEPV